MSRIGKNPIPIPDGVTVKVADSVIHVKGPKGQLEQKIHPLVKIEVKEKEAQVGVENVEDKEQRALWGLFASLLKNMIEGVVNGFEKKLEVHGVGYKVALQGKELKLDVGFSHSVMYQIPDGIEALVEKNTITITGIDKQLVGEVAAQIRKIKKPEPYKGKGIRYADEQVRRKAGKAAAKAA
jgi:large subunit ribosomal protein L6